MPTKKAVKKATTKKVTKKVAKKAVKKAPAKKAVKKAAAKKTTKKPVARQSAKKAGKKALQYSDDHTAFWMTDGQVLNSLLALRDALDRMSEEVYSYHVQSDKNDFANWVSAVLCDEGCAQDLEKAKTPKSAKTVVVKHLKYYVV